MRAGRYVLATAHRAGNVDDPGRLRRLVELLLRVPEPGGAAAASRAPRRACGRRGCWSAWPRATAGHRPPLGYVELTALLCHARAVMTDSGGLQKEAYLAGVPCMTLRTSTEWVETVEQGWNVLVDLDREAALAGARAPAPPSERPPLYGDGRAGERVVAAMTAFLSS